MKKVLFVLLLVCGLANSQFAYAQQLAEITYSCSLADAKTLHGDGSEEDFLKKALDERNYLEQMPKRKFLYRDFISHGLDKVIFGGKSYSKANLDYGFTYIEDGDRLFQSVLHVAMENTKNAATSLVVEMKVDQYGALIDSFADVELWHCKEVDSRLATPEEVTKSVQILSKKLVAIRAYKEALSGIE